MILLPFSNSTLEKIFNNKYNEFYLKKPFDVLRLKIKILEALSATSDDFKDNFNGYSLSSFLILCEMSNKSFSVHVKEKNKKGSLVFKNGLIISALTSDFEGNRAVLKMLEWENPKYEIKNKINQKKYEFYLSN